MNLCITNERNEAEAEPENRNVSDLFGSCLKLSNDDVVIAVVVVTAPTMSSQCSHSHWHKPFSLFSYTFSSNTIARHMFKSMYIVRRLHEREIERVHMWHHCTSAIQPHLKILSPSFKLRFHPYLDLLYRTIQNLYCCFSCLIPIECNNKIGHKSPFKYIEVIEKRVKEKEKPDFRRTSMHACVFTNVTRSVFHSRIEKRTCG